MRAKRKHTGDGKPQAPSAAVVTHSSPLDTPYCDGGLNVVNDAREMAALILLCFPVSLQAELEARVVHHLDSIFSSVGKPSFGEMDVIFSCLLSGYNDCRRAHPSLLRSSLRLADCSQSDVTNSLHDAFLIDCTLSHTTKKPRVKRESIFTETVIRMRVTAAFAGRATDYLFRTLLLYFPYAGCFFTIAWQLHVAASVETSRHREFSPIPFSWLRLRYADRKPAQGSFIS